MLINLLNYRGNLLLPVILTSQTRLSISQLFQRLNLLCLEFLCGKDQLQNINYLPLLGKSNHLILEVNLSFCKIKNDYIKKTYLDYRVIRKEVEGIVWYLHFIKITCQSNLCQSPKHSLSWPVKYTREEMGKDSIGESTIKVEKRNIIKNFKTKWAILRKFRVQAS